MSKIVGYVELDAKAVYNACDAYIKDREVREEKAKRKAIDHEMSKRWFPAKTEEIALQRTLKPYVGYTWKLRGRYWAYQVETLRTCCTTTKGNVLVDMDVLESIEPFFRKD